MDYTNILIAICTVITTVITITKILGKKFDKIDERFNKVDEKLDRVFSILNQQGQRLSRMEGYQEGRDIHLKQTGTEKENNG